MPEIKVGLIGGSGLGELLRTRTQGTAHQVETPFGATSDEIIETRWDGLPLFVLSRHGPGHLLNPSQVPYRANIFALKKLGVTHIIASGAVGSLRDEFKPKDLVIPDQIIDKTRRPATFFENAAVHCELAEPFCPVLRRILMQSGSATGQGEAPAEPVPPIAHTDGSAGASPSQPHQVHNRGCYVCMEGPAFSTRAESLMHRLWGGDLIGMTCMPEAKLAKEAEIAYALVALVTDYDCWRKSIAQDGPNPPDKPPDAEALLAEIIANLQAASDNAVKLIQRALSRIASSPRVLAESQALSALKLAIWSDKARIPHNEVQRLAPIWSRYFEKAEN